LGLGHSEAAAGVVYHRADVPGYTREALAQRADVDVGYVDRLVERGILVPSETSPPFSEGDFRRARLLRALEDAGISLEGIATVVGNGGLSFEFLDLPSWDWYGGFAGKTYRQLSSETGLELELLRAVRESMGSGRPEPDELVHEEALDLIPLLRVALEAGAHPGAIERILRVWGESIRRIVEAAAAFYDTEIVLPLLRSGMNEAQVMYAANKAVMAGIPHVDRAIVSMYHAHSERTWMANVVEAVETTLERAGLHHTIAEPPAMCFLDVSGFTQVTEERGDEAAAAIAGSLGRVVQESAQSHEGRAVKWLGDGVMIYFPGPDAAVLSALELAEVVPGASLPPVHAGIDTGPVVFQDGDYFGRTVNTAARIASHAAPGEVLVSNHVAQSAQDPGLWFDDMGLIELKGLPSPIRLHRASRTRANR
jgi:adenylate cyclase